MKGALVYLVAQSWKNRLLRRFTRLRQPRYLISAVFGALYFGYFFFGRLLLGMRGGATAPADAVVDPVLVESIRALMLFVVVLLAWIIPHERAALVFSEAEIAFLFPAPVSRRTLIHFKLLKSQVAVLFTSLLFTAAFGWSRHGGTWWTHALGWWLIFSTLNLHLIGSSFARTMLLERGITNWKRRFILLALVAAVAGGVTVWAWRTLPPPPPAAEITGLDDVKYYFENLLSSGPLVFLLWPFRLVVKPYLAADTLEFLQTLGPALLLLGLHYVWVVRSNVAFEEASVEASRKMAERVAAVRAGRQQPGGRAKKRKRPPFQLQPTGWPAVALLWKNLIGAGSAFTLRFWLVWIWIAVAVGFTVGHGPGGFNLVVVLGPMLLVFLGLSFFIGPQLVRQDFRQELPMADLLKTYPVPSWQLALGEVLAPVAILTALQWCLILLAAMMLPAVGHTEISTGLRCAVAVAAAILAPGLNLVSLIIPNSAVLMFPGWFQTGREAPQGIEATGQRLIFAFGQLIILVVAVAPAVGVFAAVFFLGRWLGGPVAAIIPLAGAAAALVLAVEGGLGVVLLGKLFDKFDVSADTVPA